MKHHAKNRGKRTNLFLFAGAIVLSAGIYAVIGFFFKGTGTYEFFFSRGLYQPLSLTFLFFGLLLIWNRWRMFQSENASHVPLPQGIPTRETANDLASQVAEAHGNTLAGRRFANLLRGYARHEEIGPLEERLKANDRNELDQSASLIGWVRSLPPMIGLLGTLDGLRGGIAEISMINNANDLDALRNRLQLFAHHASTAFDTTLLGISAAAFLSAAIFLLRKNEDTHLARIDALSDELARRFVHHDEGGQIAEAVNNILGGFQEQLKHLMASVTGPVVDEFSRHLQNGLSEAVRGWAGAWNQDLNRTSKEMLDGLSHQNQKMLSALQEALGRNTGLVESAVDKMASRNNDTVLSMEAAVQEGVGRMVENLRSLEQAVSRPRPLQLLIREDEPDTMAARTGSANGG